MGMTEDIDAFDQKLGELIIKYEQYVLGVERREPLKLLADVERVARSYQNVYIVNTMLKFKYNSAVARLFSYKQHWQRTLRLMEEGKYSRDRFKMELHQQQGRTAPKEMAKKEPGEIDALYQTYIAARRECNLPVKNVTPDMIAAVVEKQKPAIKEKYRCDAVEFRVVIEGGQPKIKARPKTGG